MPPAPESPPRSRSLLICNGVLARRTGTELWVEENALGLLRRGWRVQVLAGELGPLASQLESTGIPCRDRPSTLPFKPDLILGSFTLETLRALAAFPGVPALWLQHDGRAALQAPLLHPRLVAHAGVDDFCRERIHLDLGLPLASLAWLPNRVDLDHFQPRTLPLPPRPLRAAVFSNQARPDRSVPLLRQACEQLGATLEVWGEQSGRPLHHPAAVLPSYDLVFAKARCALEALSCGCSVILCDELGGLGPLVTSSDWPRLRRWNLGQRVLGDDITLPAVLARLQHYDPLDAAEVTRLVRASCGLPAGVAELEAWLLRALDSAPVLSPAEELAAYADTLECLGPLVAHVRKLEVAAYGRWPAGAPLALLKLIHRWQHRLRPLLHRLRR